MRRSQAVPGIHNPFRAAVISSTRNPVSAKQKLSPLRSRGLSQKVRDWMPSRWGEWHLADVWLDLPEPSSAQPSNSNAAATPATRPAIAPPGAKP